MRFLRKLFKYILRIILVLFSLIVLVMILLYVPAVQNFVKGQAEQYVNNNLDMKLSVGRILLKFPLDLAVENIYLSIPSGVIGSTLPAEIIVSWYLLPPSDWMFSTGPGFLS